METASPATRLTCTQCGGELHPDEGQSFLTCPYCKATVYLDQSQVVFYEYLRKIYTAVVGAVARCGDLGVGVLTGNNLRLAALPLLRIFP